jgi:hypothetical protein
LAQPPFSSIFEFLKLAKWVCRKNVDTKHKKKSHQKSHNFVGDIPLDPH